MTSPLSAKLTKSPLHTQQKTETTLPDTNIFRPQQLDKNPPRHTRRENGMVERKFPRGEFLFGVDFSKFGALQIFANDGPISDKGYKALKQDAYIKLRI
jgi:hypothetical protein